MLKGTIRNDRHGQFVVLPPDIRFKGDRVLIERRSDGAIVLRELLPPSPGSFQEIANDLAARFSDAGEFPDPPARPPAAEPEKL